MLRIAICDDMPDFLQEISRCIQNWAKKPDGLSVQSFSDADSLITAHSHNPFDIIFLDVVMPLLGGIEAAGEIRQQDKAVKIVFLTSSPEFAVDSYRVKADDYLLKPLNAGKLYQCLEDLAAEIRQNAKKILIKDRYAVYQVTLNTVEYVEANNKEVIFCLSDGKTITSSEPLYMIENRLLLSDGFFKCSRSYIVNIHLISTYTSKEIKMQSGCRIPISRNCRNAFESAYFSTLFGKAGEL